MKQFYFSQNKRKNIHEMF